MAKKRFPGMYNSLDALCRRFKISLAEREKHGALIDCRLLAQVYLELRGGRERGLDLAPKAEAAAAGRGGAHGLWPAAPAARAPVRPTPNGRRMTTLCARALKDKASGGSTASAKAEARAGRPWAVFDLGALSHIDGREIDRVELERRETALRPTYPT